MHYNKTLKFILICFVLAFSFNFILPIIPLIVASSNFSSNDYARITDVSYKAVVMDEKNNGGKMLITERLTFDIHAASKDNLFW